jgi:hypothetical protein
LRRIGRFGPVLAVGGALLAISAGPSGRAEDAPTTSALIGPCGFNPATLSFRGSPAEQAACLLRPPGKGGTIATDPIRLPKVLRERVGRPMRLDRAAVARQLTASGCGALVESLSWPVSRAYDNDPTQPEVRYFVIHDTSTPYLGEKPFPQGMDQDPAVNDVSLYASGPDAVAHAFIDRRGAIVWGHDFSVAWRATKLESRVLGPAAKGLFVHIENVEPRRFDPSGPPNNGWIAPKPGLTYNQYDRLALLYLVASRRAGVWLIPAFHADLDEGIPDGHDDPQNFDLKAFAGALSDRIHAVKALDRRAQCSAIPMRPESGAPG